MIFANSEQFVVFISSTQSLKPQMDLNMLHCFGSIRWKDVVHDISVLMHL